MADIILGPAINDTAPQAPAATPVPAAAVAAACSDGLFTSSSASPFPVAATSAVAAAADTVCRWRPRQQLQYEHRPLVCRRHAGREVSQHGMNNLDILRAGGILLLLLLLSALIIRRMSENHFGNK
uniref:Uncharacterized protein n=1 Tax=Oryza meridionalis TaxID=40149 RepID=A0A0E0CIJ9_9ORYZ